MRKFKETIIIQTPSLSKRASQLQQSLYYLIFRNLFTINKIIINSLFCYKDWLNA